ncbi:protein tumorous imaginal discs, mitochondrial isoform X1 [Microplitis demolitor]|uniref:protein tumorous imaginal discs, mitochondrial isoform X1 n=1 Tax=Microplitis demolitor TaxID=69319 RepID=UPI0004CD4B6A|nr:protein tumorous imaginal discs, mitochondrial isoform X1 [Microplitis demolitor]
MATGKGIVLIFRPRNIRFISNRNFNKLQSDYLSNNNECQRLFSTTGLGVDTWAKSYQSKSEQFTSLRRSFHVSKNLQATRTNYYEVLGVSRNSSAKDIKKAYYELAKKYHPDTNKSDPDASKKFQLVSEAYEVLSDDTKRKEYDTWGSTSEQMGMGNSGFNPGAGAGGAGGQGYANHNWNFQSTINPEELFRKIFGEAGFKSTNFSDFEDYADSKYGFGTAQEVIMNLTFAQAARGVNKEININVVDVCNKCEGSRCELGTKAVKCQQCNGTGMETISTGPFVMRSTCRYCHGTRVYIKYPCMECEGKGQNVQRKKVIVPVPAGVEDGQTIRMAVGTKEIFITFRVEKSRYFRRDGADVHTDAEISLAQAALGGTIRIQGVYEDHTVQIRPGTSSHTKVRLSGKGMRKVNGVGYGDHYVNIKITVPTSLTEKQRALLMAYAELESNTPGTIFNVTSKKDGTKQCYDGPLHLLELIRKALNESQSQSPLTETKNNSKTAEKSKAGNSKPEDSANDRQMKMKQKMP